MFDTEINQVGNIISGPMRAPVQMLQEQAYEGDTSIHDDAMAKDLGFAAGPIEGPTHFSQFDPLLCHIWGQQWFERGCFSSHFKNMVVEGERVKAFAELPEQAGQNRVRVWAEKEDGTVVLEASASLGAGDTVLDERMAKLKPHGDLVILEDAFVGMKGAKDEPVIMAPDQHMGDLYPFTLNEKLKKITEFSSAYEDAQSSPWGRAIIPTEMVSVLAFYTLNDAEFPAKKPSIGLFADLEIRYVEGPLFVDEPYLIRREIIALSESRRTESRWIKSQIFDADGTSVKAEVLLNSALVKASYPNYPTA